MFNCLFFRPSCPPYIATRGISRVVQNFARSEGNPNELFWQGFIVTYDNLDRAQPTFCYLINII